MFGLFGKKSKDIIEVKTHLGQSVGHFELDPEKDSKIKLYQVLEGLAHTKKLKVTDLNLRDVVKKVNMILNSNIKILCFIDDEEGITKSVTKTCQMLGHVPLSFNDPEQGLLYLKGHLNQIDELVLDENMPNMTGSEIAGFVVNQIHKETPIKVSMMSGNRLNPISQALEKQHAQDIPIYSKPFDMFFHTIGRAFAKKRNTTKQAA